MCILCEQLKKYCRSGVLRSRFRDYKLLLSCFIVIPCRGTGEVAFVFVVRHRSTCYETLCIFKAKA